MKKILLSVAVLFFIGILSAQAANVSVNLMYDTVANTVSQVANAATAGFRASFFTATSTTQTNTFPLLTTNTATATTICLTGDTCRTTWPSGGTGSSTATSTTLVCASGCPYNNIQVAIDAGVTNITLKEETYSGPVLIKNSDTKITGAGLYSTIITCAATAGTSCVKVATSSNLTRITLRDFGIDNTLTTKLGTGLDTSNTSNVYAANIRTVDFNLGQLTQDTNNQTFYHSYSDMVYFDNNNCFATGGTLSNSHTLYNPRCRVATSTGVGYNFINSEGWALISPDSEPGTAFIGTALKISSSSIGINVIDAWFEANATGTEIDSTSINNTISGGRITGNTLGVADFGQRNKFDGVLISANTTNVITSGTNSTFVNAFSDYSSPSLMLGTTTRTDAQSLINLGISSSNVNANMLWLNNSGAFSTSPAGIGFNNSTGGFASGTARIYVNPGSGYTNAKMTFAVADSSKVLSDRMVIDVNGNVGIGSTSPNTRLVVIGTTTTSGLTLSNLLNQTCLGTDASGNVQTGTCSGASTVYLASSTGYTVGGLAFASGNGSIGTVATGTISTDANFTVTANRSTIGGATAIGLASGLTVPTTTGLQTLYASSHNPVTLSGTPNYITLVGQDIVRALINLTSHVTGILGITNGGTGTSTIGAAGTVLVSNGTAYESRATSTLGLSSSAGPVYVSTTTVTTGQGAFISGPGTIGSVATGTLTTSATGLQFDSTRALWGGAAILSLTSGYNIPLTASTTNWNDFYTTPSTRITAGTNLSWSGNTLNATGGGGGANQWSAFTNYIQPATSTDGILVNGSSTIANLTMSRSTTTNATTTNLFVSGSLMTASGTTLNNGGYMKRGNNNQNPIVISEMGTNWGDFYGRGVIAFSSTVYKSGTSSLAITAANTGLNTGARFNIPDYDGSKDNYTFWVRSDNWSQVNTAEFIISTAGTFTDTYTIDLKNFLVAPPNNEWIEIIAPRSNFTRSSAAANWATVNDMLLRITSTNTPTVYVDRLARVKQQNQPMLAVVFDDGWQTQYSAAKPVMDQYAIPGTAYVIWNAVGTAQYMTQAQIDDMHDTGWDIGGHGATNLTTLTPLQVESDLQNMKLYLNQRGYRGAENYALPNGAYNSSTLPVVQKYFATQRTIDSLSNTSNYINPNRVSAFSPSQFTSTSTLYARVDAAMANNDFVVITFHNIVDTPALDTDFSTEKFRQFMAYVASSTIKTVTMSAAMDYNDSFATQNDTGMAIGTSTPSASLTIWGNSILTRLFNIFTAAGNAVLTVLSNGSIGVATSSPSALFTVAGDMRLTGRLADSASSTGVVGNVLLATANGTAWTATSSLGLGGGGGGSGTVNSGTTGQVTYYAANGTAVSGTSTLTIQNESVGIGSTSPNSKLSVVGNIYQQGNYAKFGSATPLFTCVAETCMDLWGNDNTTAGVQSVVGNRNAGTSAYSGLSLNNDQANSNVTNYGGLFLNSSTYTDTTFGTGNAVANLLQLGNTMGAVSIQSGTTSPTLGYINFLTGGFSSSNERMRITQDGKVGIGTSTPSDALTIAVGNNAGIEVQSTNSGFIGYGKIGADRFRMQNDFTSVGLFEILYNNGTGGPAGTNLMTLTGTGSGIAGRVGIGTTSPSATLAIQNGNTAQAFAISTSTVGTSRLFSVFSTTTLLRHSSALSYFQDNGARVQVGISGYYGRSDTLDTLTVSGTIRQHGWNSSNCGAIGYHTAVSATSPGNINCDGWSFAKDTTGAATLTGTAGTGYTYGRLNTAIANNGVGVWANGATAGWIRVGTTTPTMEVIARTAGGFGTTSAMYVGYVNTSPAGAAYETAPTSGCYFVSSSTIANWWATCANASARTYTDTGIASTTVTNGAGNWYMFRIDADADGARFYMRESETAVLRQVAYITTNYPTAVSLNAGAYIGLGASTISVSADVASANLQWRKMLPLN